MTPLTAPADYPKWGEVVALIHRAFAYMEPIPGHKPAARIGDVVSFRKPLA